MGIPVRNAVILLFILAFLGGCDPYAKLARSKEVSDRDSAALAYYNKQQYEKSQYLLEELMGVYRGTKNAERAYYYFAYCKYQLGEYSIAAYHFNDFVSQFPNSPRADECQFMHAYCYYKLSNPSYLSQDETYRAIEYLQFFINTHPNSEKVTECTEYINELREKLALKAFKNAELYYKTGYHKAAVVAFRNFINDFPDSKFKEESQFLQLKSEVLLAIESVETKQKDRFAEAIAYYTKFVDTYPDSRFLKEGEDLYETAKKFVETHP